MSQKVNIEIAQKFIALKHEVKKIFGAYTASFEDNYIKKNSLDMVSSVSDSDNAMEMISKVYETVLKEVKNNPEKKINLEDYL